MPRQIAIYLTCTDQSVLAAQFPNYAEMLEALLSPHLPGREFVHFDVAKGHFPKDPTVFDAVVLTGSVANVSDNLPWMAPLYEHIRAIDAAKGKLLGICFGHQAIATALGGQVAPRPAMLGAPTLTLDAPQGWMVPWQGALRLFAGNFQQVVELPEEMVALGGSEGCPYALIAKGQHILGLQYHPEFSADYMRGYVALVDGKISDEAATKALVEIDTGHEGALFGQWAARFLTS